tara:strand:- start:67 stop:414 length:348 start_codon:yes stop_codon:yes gene_type:complete
MKNKGDVIIYKLIIYLIFVVLLSLFWKYVLNIEFFQNGLNLHLLFIFLAPLLFIMVNREDELKSLKMSLLIFGVIVIVLSLLTAFFDINIFNGCKDETRGKYGTLCRIRDFLDNL